MIGSWGGAARDSVGCAPTACESEQAALLGAGDGGIVVADEEVDDDLRGVTHLHCATACGGNLHPGHPRDGTDAAAAQHERAEPSVSGKTVTETQWGKRSTYSRQSRCRCVSSKRRQR